MASRRPTADVVVDMRAVRDQMAELRALIERQQQQIEQQQTRLEELSNQPRVRPERKTPSRRRAGGVGRGTSRRSLLRWGGAAAAASLALVAGEGQGAQAARATDGSAIVLGSAATNDSATGTNLTITTGTNPAPAILFNVDGQTGAPAGNTAGIQGLGASGGSGVIGNANGSAGYGVFGVSDSGYGVVAGTTTGIDLWAGGTGRFLQAKQASAGAPTSGTYSAGEQIRDSAGNLFICTAGGSPGTWQQVIGAGGAATASSGTTLSAVASSSSITLLTVDVSASTNPSATAIEGISNASLGSGVVGFNTGIAPGVGVYGQSTNGTGVYGYSTSATGTSAIGVNGRSISYHDLSATGTGRIGQNLQGSAGAPTGGPYDKGEQVRDSNGELWICVQAGSPGTWRQVVAAGSAITTSTATTLSAVASSSPTILLQVDASNSTVTNAVAIKGISNVTSGTGVQGVSTNSTNGTGVSGSSTNGTGVSGSTTSTSGTGVQGINTSGIGVSGSSSGTNGAGVGGTNSSNGIGVLATSSSGYGLTASSGSSVDIYANGTGRVQQHLQGSAGAPTSGSYSAGEMLRDHNGELWLCVANGTPGHWVQAAHAVYGYTGGATSYLSKPIRLLDTRSGSTDALTNGGGPYTSGGSPYPVTIAGVSFMSVTVPSSCAGAIGNVTVVAGGGGGYLALVPHGAGFSGTANLAYGAGQIVSNAFNVGLSVDGKLDIIIGGNPTDVILDLFAVVA